MSSSQGFASLDCKLNAAISDIITGDLERRVGVLKDKAAQNGHLLKGRQVLHVIYEYYRVAEADGAILEFEDLAGLRMKGNNLEEFSNVWESTLTAMKKVPDVEILESLFRAQIRNHPSLREHMAYYDRLEHGNPERNYDYLVKLVNQHLRQRRREELAPKTREQLARNR